MKHNHSACSFGGQIGESNSLTGTLAGELLRGFSAYDIAKQRGFEGTEEEWLSSLVGEKVKVTVLVDTEREYILQFSTSDETITTPNLKAVPEEIVPISNESIESIFLDREDNDHAE